MNGWQAIVLVRVQGLEAAQSTILQTLLRFFAIQIWHPPPPTHTLYSIYELEYLLLD